MTKPRGRQGRARPRGLHRRAGETRPVAAALGFDCRSSSSAFPVRARPWWSRSWRATPGARRRRAGLSGGWYGTSPPRPRPRPIRTVSPARRQRPSRLGELYIERFSKLAPAAAHITDKLPGNYLHLGLIRLILPRAKILHVRRDPLDTCVSCFSRSFSAGLNFVYDLGELGRAYRRYAELMDHWRQLLPAGRHAGGPI